MIDFIRFLGGRERIRTSDLHRVRMALSPLSYPPTLRWNLETETLIQQNRQDCNSKVPGHEWILPGGFPWPLALDGDLDGPRIQGRRRSRQTSPAPPGPPGP